MGKFFILSLFIFIHATLQAQSIIDVEGATHLAFDKEFPEDVYPVKLKKDKFKLLELSNLNRNTSWNFDTLKWQDTSLLFKDYTILSLDQLEKIKLDKFQNLLRTYQFRLDSVIVKDSICFYKTLDLINPYTFYFEKYNETKFETKIDQKLNIPITTNYIKGENQFYNFYFLRFDKNKFLVLFNDNKGFIIYDKNKIIVNIDTLYLKNSILKNNKKFKNVSRINIKNEWNNLFFLKDSNEYKLIKSKSNQTVISGKYDTILFDDLIVGIKDKSVDIYNVYLHKTMFYNVRKLYSNSGFVQLLDSNKMYYIDQLGQFGLKYYPTISKKSCLLGSLFIGFEYLTQRNDSFFTCGHLSRHSNDNIDEYRNSLKCVYIKGIQSDSLYISEGINIVIDSIIPFLVFDYHLFYGKREDRYQLYKVLENDTFELVVNDMQKINYENNNLVRFQKNNLWGIYPYHSEGVYKELKEIQDNFVRYTKPNGISGWLDINDGKEYDDE